MLVIIRRVADMNNSPRYQAYQVTSNSQEVNLYIGGMFQSEVIKNVKSDFAGQTIKIICQY
jgi:hypothetical protein